MIDRILESMYLESAEKKMQLVSVPYAGGELLTTVGLSHFPIQPPSSAWDEGDLSVELVLFIPTSDPTTKECALRCLQMIAEEVMQGMWIGYGHLFLGQFGVFHALTTYPFSKENGEDMVFCLSDGRIITVYQLIALTDEELAYRQSTDGAALRKKLSAIPNSLQFHVHKTSDIPDLFDGNQTKSRFDTL